MPFPPTPSITASITPTPSITPSITPTNTATGTVCPGLTPTMTSSNTPTQTQTGTLKATPTPSPTTTQTQTPTITSTQTPSATRPLYYKLDACAPATGQGYTTVVPGIASQRYYDFINAVYYVWDNTTTVSPFIIVNVNIVSGQSGCPA